MRLGTSLITRHSTTWEPVTPSEGAGPASLPEPGKGTRQAGPSVSATGGGLCAESQGCGATPGMGTASGRSIVSLLDWGLWSCTPTA